MGGGGDKACQLIVCLRDLVILDRKRICREIWHQRHTVWLFPGYCNLYLLFASDCWELQVGAGKAGSLILIIFSLHHPWATISRFILRSRYRKRVFLLPITCRREVPGGIISREGCHRPISLYLLLDHLSRAVSHGGMFWC